MPMVVTPEMRALINRPGYLGSKNGGVRLRQLYSDNSLRFHPDDLSPFGLSCFIGHLDGVKKAVDDRTAPDLLGSETPYKWGYLTVTVCGAQRVERTKNPAAFHHKEVIEYLISVGCPTEQTDICGYTALMHSCLNLPAPDITLVLALNGANVDHRNKYGATALIESCEASSTRCMSVLLAFGASLTIADANGVTAAALYESRGPVIVAEVKKWIRRRNGEPNAPLQAKRCDHCYKAARSSEGTSLSACDRCLIRRYCSVECQRADWNEHKTTCEPFSESAVTLRPFYLNPDNWSVLSLRGEQQSDAIMDTRLPIGKLFIIKIQRHAAQNAPMMVYDKNRTFQCSITANDQGTRIRGFKKIAMVIQERGVMQAKGYFLAELIRRDELRIHTTILAEQPW